MPTDTNGRSEAELRAIVDGLPWYHSIQLKEGIVTPGVVRNSQVLPRLSLPSDLTGKTVLDVGAWDGFYSFECARRGADRVLATDSFVWDGRAWGSKESFDLARDVLALGSIVDDMLIDPMELSVDRIGVFDVVLYLGVLYHLRSPIEALERAADVCGELLVLETETALNFLPFPAARLHPGASLNSDPSNWFQFNISSLRELLYELGFSSVSVKYRYPYHRRVLRAMRGRLRGAGFIAGLRSSRVVLHAHKGPGTS
jgi:tRNA (mo5U34)-methyltransferase